MLDSVCTYKVSENGLEDRSRPLHCSYLQSSPDQRFQAHNVNVQFPLRPCVVNAHCKFLSPWQRLRCSVPSSGTANPAENSSCPRKTMRSGDSLCGFLSIRQRRPLTLSWDLQSGLDRHDCLQTFIIIVVVVVVTGRVVSISAVSLLSVDLCHASVQEGRRFPLLKELRQK